MKIPLKWLSEFVDLDRSVDELSHLLTMSGLEVESIVEIGRLPAEVVSARIVEMRPHPNAERLTLCQVETVAGAVRQVVCGARNMKAGDVVVLAQPGAVLPGGMRIEKARLRGESSEGMLCSARELSLNGEHEGILILGSETPVGRPFSEVYAGADTVIDLSVTPNRADCLSILGVAREISALTGAELREPAAAKATPAQGGATPARLSVEAPALCPIYYGRVMTGVKVGPSPAWLVARLTAAGLRSINNVVDATNFILLERGQPTHAFDLERLAGQHIIVRQARVGERLRCLDGIERGLDGRDLAICDERGPVAIAGVMGGEPSAVSDSTQSLLLEAALFAPESVRATARRAGVHTDASHRFERGIDPQAVLRSLDALTELIHRLAGGEVPGETLAAVARVEAPAPIFMVPERVNARIGLQVPADRMRQHLEALRMQVTPRAGGFDVLGPSYRHDIEQEADLAEEIARMEGYDQIPSTQPLASMQSPHAGKTRQSLRGVVNFLTSRGLDQVINYSFIAPSLIEALGLPAEDPRTRPVRLVNPLTEELSVLRTALLPSLLKTAAYNERHEVPDLRIFELGKTFVQLEPGSRPRESFHVACLVMGRREARSWTSSQLEADVYDIKGVLEGLAGHFRIPALTFREEGAEAFLAPGQGWSVHNGSECIGSMGALHPEVGRRVGLERPVYVLEVSLEGLRSGERKSPRFEPLPRFPGVARDLAVVVDAGLEAARLTRIIHEAAGPLLESVSIFDVYRGKGIPEGRKSVAFNLVYRAAERTLVESEVQEAHARVTGALEQQLGATLRA